MTNTDRITFYFNQDYYFGNFTVQLTPIFATADVFVADSPYEMIQVTDTTDPGLTMNVPAKYLQAETAKHKAIKGRLAQLLKMITDLRNSNKPVPEIYFTDYTRLLEQLPA